MLRSLGVILCLTVLLSSVHCGIELGNHEHPGNIVTGNSGCKDNALGAAAISGGQTYIESVHYSYEGTTLFLKHINTSFNCCPEHITATTTVTTGMITIEEREDSSNCDCICLYDLNMQIDNVEAGQYGVRISKPQIPAFPAIEFTMDLHTQPSGTYDIL